MSHTNRLCRKCQKRPAKFRVKGGRVKADRDHDWCFQCTRAQKDRDRQRWLPDRQPTSE